MKIEILATNGIKSAFKELGIQAAKTYKSTDNFAYSVWEIEKTDLDKLQNPPVWNKGWGWFAYGGKSKRGTAYDFLTINGEFLIGWNHNNGPDTYDKLSDYLSDNLNIQTNDDLYTTLNDLCKTNGISLSGLLKKFEG